MNPPKNRDEILAELGLRADISNKGYKGKYEVTGDTMTPVKTTAEIAKEAGYQSIYKSGSEIISPPKTTAELGLRAKVGQGRPVKNGEIISPLKTTAEIAKRELNLNFLNP